MKNKAQVKQKNLDMIQEIIDHVYSGVKIPLPRKLRKKLEKERKRQEKKTQSNN